MRGWGLHRGRSAAADRVHPFLGVCGAYLTDGVRLYRVAMPVCPPMRRLALLEDCQTFDLYAVTTDDVTAVRPVQVERPLPATA